MKDPESIKLNADQIILSAVEDWNTLGVGKWLKGKENVEYHKLEYFSFTIKTSTHFITKLVSIFMGGKHKMKVKRTLRMLNQEEILSQRLQCIIH